MKRLKTLIPFLITILIFAAGCHQESSSSTPTDEEYLKILTVKINKHPKDDNLYYDRSQVYMRLGQVNEAIADLTRAVLLNGKELKYHMSLGDAYFANGDVENSYSSLQRALEISPNNSDAHLKLGEIAYYSRDYDRAMENLSFVTNKDPQNRTALFMKCFIYKETGDTVNSIKLLRKVCDLYPDFGPAFEELGIIYADHNSKMAVEYLTTALNIDPNNNNARYALAMFYQQTNQIDKAEETYKQMIDIDANNKLAWHNRGYIETFVYGDYPVAIDYFTRAIQCDSNYIEAWTNRGCTYELMGDHKHALEDFRYANNLDHTYQPAIDGMARN